jgi:hypothetical protein
MKRPRHRPGPLCVGWRLAAGASGVEGSGLTGPGEAIELGEAIAEVIFPR